VSFSSASRVSNPLLVFAAPRTGSNLFFDILSQISYVANPKDLVRLKTE
jgi:LPS sulfotransferase NodH